MDEKLEKQLEIWDQIAHTQADKINEQTETENISPKVITDDPKPSKANISVSKIDQSQSFQDQKAPLKEIIT